MQNLLVTDPTPVELLASPLGSECMLFVLDMAASIQQAAMCTMQELKSKQEQLPAAVATLVRQHGWHALVPAGAGGQSAAHSWDVPGLTITSFHLQQLQASKQVGLAAVTACTEHMWQLQACAGS